MIEWSVGATNYDPPVVRHTELLMYNTQQKLAHSRSQPARQP